MKEIEIKIKQLFREARFISDINLQDKVYDLLNQASNSLTQYPNDAKSRVESAQRIVSQAIREGLYYPPPPTSALPILSIFLFFDIFIIIFFKLIGDGNFNLPILFRITNDFLVFFICVVSGSLGGIAAGFYMLFNNSKAIAQKSYLIGKPIYYIARPIYGMILGGVMYFAILAGIFFITGKIDTTLPYTPAVVSFLIGYNEGLSNKILNKISNTILGQ